MPLHQLSLLEHRIPPHDFVAYDIRYSVYCGFGYSIVQTKYLSRFFSLTWSPSRIVLEQSMFNPDQETHPLGVMNNNLGEYNECKLGMTPRAETVTCFLFLFLFTLSISFTWVTTLKEIRVYAHKHNSTLFILESLESGVVLDSAEASRVLNSHDIVCRVRRTHRWGIIKVTKCKQCILRRS